jgi:hypothetical protein
MFLRSAAIGSLAKTKPGVSWPLTPGWLWSLSPTTNHSPLGIGISFPPRRYGNGSSGVNSGPNGRDDLCANRAGLLCQPRRTTRSQLGVVGRDAQGHNHSTKGLELPSRRPVTCWRPCTVLQPPASEKGDRPVTAGDMQCGVANVIPRAITARDRGLAQS